MEPFNFASIANALAGPGGMVVLLGFFVWLQQKKDRTTTHFLAETLGTKLDALTAALTRIADMQRDQGYELRTIKDKVDSIERERN